MRAHSKAYQEHSILEELRGLKRLSLGLTDGLIFNEMQLMLYDCNQLSTKSSMPAFTNCRCDYISHFANRTLRLL